MLTHLRVANIGLLSDVSLDPSSGFTVITGETGAGKTLLLGGVRLLVGEKANSGLVGKSADSAQVDGQFALGEDEMGVTRVVPKEGRSRSYLDGTLVSADTLATTIGDLVEIVGQHDQVALARPSQVLAMVDGSLDPHGKTKLEAFRDAWSALQTALGRASQLGGDEMALRRELDLVFFQSEEIGSADLVAGEDSRAEAQASRLRNSEEIREHIGYSSSIVERLIDEIGEVVGHVRKAGELDPDVGDLVAATEGMAAEAGELASELRRHLDGVEADPGQLEAIESRLTSLGELKRKYGRTIEEILAFGREAGERAEELQELLEASAKIEEVLADARHRVNATGEELTEARRSAAKRLLKEASEHLRDLGLPKSSIEVSFDPRDPGPSGVEQLEFLFRSDEHVDAGPVGSVASGGELSRLVLALRLATSNESTTTLVFDEVDTGIGGVTANAMGRKLAALAKGTQVLCVTHLPQVAAQADTHYLLERGETETRLIRLDSEARVKELSRMLAGLPESDAGAAAAKELLENADR
ncbi:MAG: AAA family ATPase [Actinomycetota bacterium]|nr:AAA family ATPase [Actinomycetota bacterium]